MPTDPRSNNFELTEPGTAHGRSRPTLGVLIRYKNSMRTLPRVIEALRRQTVQPDLIVGVDNGSTDGSTDCMKSIGAQIVSWPHPYKPSPALNAGMQACTTDFVLVLSSHLIMLNNDTFERLLEAMQDESTACASFRQNFFHNACVDWPEVQTKGILIGSIYSNCLGVIRRKFWEEVQFTERLSVTEDYGWALEQLRRGRKCRRFEPLFSYERQGPDRWLSFTREAFILGKHFGLPVRWMGVKGSVRQFSYWTFKLAMSLGRNMEARNRLRLTWLEIWGAISWRWHDRLNR